MGEIILGRAGASLADAYDVEGSTIGIKRLEADEVHLTHDLASTIFSEKASGNIRRLTSGALNQSTNWNVTMTGLLDNITRILGVLVFSDGGSEISHCQVSIHDPINGRDMPFFYWNDLSDKEENILIEHENTIETLFYKRPVDPMPSMPSMLFGRRQPEQVPDIVFRGRTLAFGAGTAETEAYIFVAFADEETRGPRSFGLPIPGW